MKIYALAVSFICLGAAACGGGSASNVSTETALENSNVNAAPMRSEKLQSTIGHTTEGQAPPSRSDETAAGARSKWTQGGDPIDTKEFDAAIAAAEKQLKAKPKDPEARAAAVEAYFKRGFALTEARQYASALGDYRRALKLDPSHAESKKWIDTIVGIYVGSVRKDPPREGEEPPPLEYKGENK